MRYMKHTTIISSFFILSAYSVLAAEFTSYRETYEKTLEGIVIEYGLKANGIIDQYKKALDVLLTRVRSTGNLEKTTGVMAEIERCKQDGAVSQDTSNVPELETLRRSYAELVSSCNEIKSRRIVLLVRQYDAALDRLQKNLVQSGKLEDATVVQNERTRIAESDTTKDAIALMESLVKKEEKKVEDDAPKPERISASALRFDWKREKKKLIYEYDELFFGKGAFDYSDNDCTKLLDGETKEKWSAHSVGWTGMKPPMILFKFPSSVRPKAIKIHLFGADSGGTVGMTKGIKVYTGTKIAKGRLVGEISDIPDKTCWMEIPIKSVHPSSFFWIELDSSTLNFVMLDEVEFE